jgi:hypothetical protein
LNPDFKPYLFKVGCYTVLSASTFGLLVAYLFGIDLWRGFWDGINSFAIAYLMVDLWRGNLQVRK